MLLDFDGFDFVYVVWCVRITHIYIGNERRRTCRNGFFRTILQRDCVARAVVGTSKDKVRALFLRRDPLTSLLFVHPISKKFVRFSKV